MFVGKSTFWTYGTLAGAVVPRAAAGPHASHKRSASGITRRIRSPYLSSELGLAVLQIDHVVYGARNLDAGVASLEDRFGLASVPGGLHPGWGTANRIVPLGDTYIEMISVVEPGVAAGSAFGRALLEHV